MFQYSLEHGAPDHLHSCGSPVSADMVEGAFVRAAESAAVCHQEWSPHCNPDYAEPVCEPRFLDRESSSPRRICFLFFGPPSAVAYLCSFGKVRTPQRFSPQDLVATRSTGPRLRSIKRGDG